MGALVLVAAAAGVIALVAPAIEESKERTAEEESRRDAAYEKAKRERLERESRPRHGRIDRPRGRLTPAAERRARRVLVAAVERAIARDARARVRAGELEAPILGAECQIDPPSRRPLERDLSVRRMEYSCLAVRSRDPQGRYTVGHTFEAIVDYRTFRFSWARVCYPPGEGSARLTC